MVTCQRNHELGREEQLTNTLLQGFYPGIRVATIDVPTEPLTPVSKRFVEQALTKSSSMGFVTACPEPAAVQKKENSTPSKTKYESDWRRGFRFSPQAAMTYFGIWCPRPVVMIDGRTSRLLVVEDHSTWHQRLPGMDLAVFVQEAPGKAPGRPLAHETQKLLIKWKQQRQDEHKDSSPTPRGEAELAEQAQSKIARRFCEVIAFTIPLVVRQNAGRRLVQGHGR